MMKLLTQCINNYGNKRHRTMATHTLRAKPEYLDAHEFPDYPIVVNDILDANK
jgi:hypothetical protein